MSRLSGAPGFGRGPMTVTRDLAALPKAHLNLHLDGSFPRPAVEALAERRGGRFAPPDGFANVDSFSRAYGTVPEMVDDLEELAELCMALVFAERAEGVVYLEPAVEPQRYSPRLGCTADVLAVMCDAFGAASRESGVEVGAMVTVNTDAGPDGAEGLARLAVDFAGKGVVSFGTAGFVEPAGLGRFAGAAGVARAAGLGIVCHAGQTGGPASVLHALDMLYPERLSHGIHAAWDRDLLRRLADEGVLVDVCPASNVALGVVCHISTHPLPALVAAGVPVTLNAEDPLWFGSSVSDQYELARSVFGFGDRRLAHIARTGGRASGMSAGTRERLERGTADWLNSQPDPLPAS